MTTTALPIATAPIAAGEALGPVLLWPAPERYAPHWTIGGWNGQQWRDDAGWVFEPTHWAPLPRAPRSTMIIDHEPAPAPRSTTLGQPWDKRRSDPDSRRFPSVLADTLSATRGWTRDRITVARSPLRTPAAGPRTRSGDV